MSEEVVELKPEYKKSVRYPLFLNGTEMPHRLFPLADIAVQMLNVVMVVVCFELFAIFCFPAGPEVGMIIAAIIPFLFIVGRFTLRNARLNISEKGISFPLLMSGDLAGRTFRSWGDLDSVDLHGGKDKINFVQGNILTMVFKSGGRANLDITRIPREDLRLLEDSLQKWSHSGVLSPTANELVSRNDLEISDSQMFVFAKRRRSLLSESFGLTNHRLLEKGDAVLGGDYIVESVLSAAGGCSKYLVSDTHAACNVCLTEYDLSMVAVDRRQQIARELLDASQLYRNLQIPYLLNLVDSKIADEKFYTVMEPGGTTLREYVRKSGGLTEKKVYALALRLAEGAMRLSATNPQLYVGGIKPDAIMYKADGTLSITEFGFVDDLLMNSSNSLLIDAPYAAPERLAGHPCSSSDLYSIGATMYFALTKEDPQACTASQVNAAKENASLPISSLIARLLSFDSSQRGTLPELVHNLGGVSFAKIGDNHG